jgi:hypothetical protein
MDRYKSLKSLINDYKSKKWIEKLDKNDIKFFKIINMDINKDLLIHYKYFNKNIFKEALSYRAKTEFLVYVEDLNMWAIPLKDFTNYLISFTDETNRVILYSCKSKKELSRQRKLWKGHIYDFFIVYNNKKNINLVTDNLIKDYFDKFSSLKHLMY